MEIRMKIVYKLTDDICIGKIYIDEDTSVLFDSERLQTEELGFTLSLGNSLRFMIGKRSIVGIPTSNSRS